jgi:hypothetical protein
VLQYIRSLFNYYGPSLWLRHQLIGVQWSVFLEKLLPLADALSLSLPFLYSGTTLLLLIIKFISS